ncbi:cytochrome ubiquinol oxidase subunit I [Pseudodesulfovibrio piezophilus]|uniref:Cytochrome bd-type quinol oxidase subunit 1-like protein n=1 Tax=Pseudodesulfovibrio piezophilus (strain DSM 21447 / JCM 15486 / C1TLV30) TaxID=1322246 RepID=M1WM64_PSEP2|nr:cytochrome ubiquinol oxidase subunit I [Pseudodesulfovibrio piezophilus]CCH49060.1 Cytochrome bd-type quinol oxidase subunit 1-like protein [Pseudodesulfovibrio piezophilus C1TLV30]
MEYPIWHLTTLAGGFWIAFIATVHVYVAHFAVGGGLFLVLTERAAYRSENPHLLEYAKKHTKFFLLLTMVFGAVTGVAIWFTIALLAPQATITLIHQFVFGWAAEWVCFLGEIVALIIYYYTWKTMKPGDHMTVGWLYFLFGWLSLFLINGIIGFMLTPGDWLETGSFWDGFFNPSFWPALVFRSFFSAACAGLFGFVTATRIPDTTTRHTTVRTCSAWTILGVLATMAAGYWYVTALPAPQQEMILLKSHRVSDFMQWFWIFGVLTLLGGLALAIKLPRAMSFPLALIVLLAGQGLFGSFEFIRESGRKPYLIWNYAYSNSIIKAQVPVINQKGAIASARWAPHELKTGITDANVMQAGEFLYQLECASCHSIGGPMNEIRKRTRNYDTNAMEAFLTGMGKLNRYMPPFIGTRQEKTALAIYIAQGLNKNESVEPVAIPTPEPTTPAPFDSVHSEYTLTAWADQGMQFYVQSRQFTLLPAGNMMRAQLVRRGSSPEIVTEDIKMHYSMEPGFKGENLSGELEAFPEAGRFEGRLAIHPFKDGVFEPLPIMTLEARTPEDEILATAKVTVPTSDQMGCRNCHGGDWEQNGHGIASPTAANILETHDRMNNTNHVERAKKGPILCIECHDDPAQNAQGSNGYPTLSAAIHGTHAVFLAGRDAEDSCLKCHPKNSLRGQHKGVGLECTNCHGSMENHAISLLKADQVQGKKTADRLLSLIKPSGDQTIESINPRKPWINEPDCLTCHVDFETPETDMGFNTWTKDEGALYSIRRDDMEAIHCAGCHGSPHAIYPATERDNVLPLQYMGAAQSFGADGSCSVCHIDMMDYPMHHPGMGIEE